MTVRGDEKSFGAFFGTSVCLIGAAMLGEPGRKRAASALGVCPMKITVVDMCGKVSGPSVLDATRAIQKQVHEDLAPAWGADAHLRVLPMADLKLTSSREQAIHGSDGVIYVSPGKASAPVGKKGLTSRAVGLHFARSAGLPSGYVFPDVKFDSGCSWTVALSHEILELLIDPDVNLLVATTHPTQKDRTILRPYEVCDPVQDRTYVIDGVEVSNFVLPQYFKKAPRHPRGPNSTNFLDEKLPPFGKSPGGYYRYFDLSAGVWKSSTGRDAWSGLRAQIGEAPRSFRRERRAPVWSGNPWKSLDGMACSNGWKC